jgi:hypothetical protein
MWDTEEAQKEQKELESIRKRRLFVKQLDDEIDLFKQSFDFIKKNFNNKKELERF